MGVRFYDEAIANKIQKWIKDPNMVILKPNEVINKLSKYDIDRLLIEEISLEDLFIHYYM